MAKENGALLKRVRELELQLARGGHAIPSKQVTPKRRSRTQPRRAKQYTSKAVQVVVEPIVDDSAFSAEQSELIQQLKVKRLVKKMVQLPWIDLYLLQMS